MRPASKNCLPSLSRNEQFLQKCGFMSAEVIVYLKSRADTHNSLVPVHLCAI